MSDVVVLAGFRLGRRPGTMEVRWDSGIGSGEEVKELGCACGAE